MPSSGDLRWATLLVAAGANVNDADAGGVSAMVPAAHSGYRELVEFLLDKGADPSSSAAGFTALHEAIMRRDERMVAALVAHGADPLFVHASEYYEIDMYDRRTGHDGAHGRDRIGCTGAAGHDLTPGDRLCGHQRRWAVAPCAEKKPFFKVT